MDYDYFYHVEKALFDFIINNYDEDQIMDDDFEFIVYDDAFISDDVTGNASGSYYCNTYKAEEALSHNWDLMSEAADNFGIEREFNYFDRGPEYWDVTVRCYVLGDIISRAVERARDSFDYE